MVAVEELTETPGGQGCDKGTEPRETEFLEKGVLASRGIDFRVPEQAFSLFFTSIYSLWVLQARSVVSTSIMVSLFHGHCILVRVALYSNQQ